MAGFPQWIVPLSVLAIAAARLAELRTRRDVVPGRVHETLSLRLLVGCGHFVLLVSLLEWGLSGFPFHAAAFTAGWVCALASFALRRRTIRALGTMWSLHVEIRERHTLVLDGPFRWIRHPTYLSVILEFLALPLLCSAWGTLLLVPVLLVPALTYRIRIEERAMVEKFPEYATYRQRTPALFPYRKPIRQ